MSRYQVIASVQNLLLMHVASMKEEGHSELNEVETTDEKRKLPKKKTQSKDRLLEQKLLLARKREKTLVKDGDLRSHILLPKIPVDSDLPKLAFPHSSSLFFPSLAVTTKVKQDAKAVKKEEENSGRFLLPKIERLRMPNTPEGTVFLRRKQQTKVTKGKNPSAFFQPAIQRNNHNDQLYFLAHSSGFRNKMKGNFDKAAQYPSIRKKTFEQIQTIDNDIQRWISRIRGDIADASTEINKEMVQQRLKTQKKIEEMRKLVYKRKQKSFDTFFYL